ncbi:DUF1827 family protein [Latilactobacillus fuchuensis]|jgi:hypothetical protein|uniref:DUF1827 family protein n=1 Tax=Latilactobacillus fuchuensis TaxID=164393 RepID=A0A2N9DWZ0_9LACO|nr:DUF1827 family protein [Latilactobacillus fuchuensis]MCP8857932.1 DUF1827 family protein [Latilactobacillus fuchuensis]SPC39199.1 conserved hypothetical protein [Latilactobacillus fuchuensis]
MRLVNITNSYKRLVAQQLATTAADYVKVYSLGKTTVLYTRSSKSSEILIENKVRNVQQNEIDFVLEKLANRTASSDDLTILNDGQLVEITIPTPSLTSA